MTLKRIEPLSLAKVLSCLYASIGLLVGGLFAMISLIGGGIAVAGGDSEGAIGVIFGIGAIFFLPIFYGVVGFIGGLLVSFLYNVISGFVGGIEVTFE